MCFLFVLFSLLGDGDDELGGVVLLGGLQHEHKKRQKRLKYAAETAARDVMRALRPNTPILALDVDRATLVGAARLRPDAPDGRQRIAELGAAHARAKGELKALEKWCRATAVRLCPLVVLYSPRDDCVEIMVRSLH